MSENHLATSDSKLEVAEMLKFVLDRMKKIVEKGNTSLFQTTIFSEVSHSGSRILYGSDVID